MMSLWRKVQAMFAPPPPCPRRHDNDTDALLDALRKERVAIESKTEAMRRRYAYEDLYPRRGGRKQ